jgi:hypothetical protein
VTPDTDVHPDAIAVCSRPFGLPLYLRRDRLRRCIDLVVISPPVMTALLGSTWELKPSPAWRQSCRDERLGPAAGRALTRAGFQVGQAVDVPKGMDMRYGAASDTPTTAVG